MEYGLFLAGMALLFIGGEALVRGSVSVARKLNVSELVIGLTLVGFGTSTPELVTSLSAIHDGSPGIAVGNVVGSCIANILLILGLAAILRPILINPQSLYRDGRVLIFATAVLVALIYIDGFSRLAGFFLLSALIIFVAHSIWVDQRRQDAAADLHIGEGEQISSSYSLAAGLMLALAGLAGVIFGARWLVSGAVTIARDFGVSETLIGLTIVAVGTSLPELVTTIVAAVRGKSDIAVGNVIGSNIFNIFGILGLTAVYKPFSLTGGVSSANAMAEGETALFNTTDIGALLLSVFLLMLFAMTGRQIARWEGAVLLAAYGVYIGLITGVLPVLPILSNGG